MGKPIGQTFFINEPPPPLGVAGVFVTKVDVYFKAVSNTYGIEVQIRKTENGLPTPTRMPFATKYLPAANCAASDTANTATSFVFDTPVFLPANDLYALVLMPAGGNPDYLVWTASISDTDVSTNTPIYVNNNTGDLFISSNDLSWEPVYNEDMKFNIYIANFTSTAGHAYFKSPNEEWMAYRDLVGNFTPREYLLFANTPITSVVFNVSAVSGTFTVGDTVYQGNSSYITTGIVTAANSTVIKVSNSTGAWSNTTLFDANAAANCTANVVNQYNITTATSNLISVPDSSLFTANALLYVQTNNRSTTQIVKCTAIGNSTSIQVNTAVSFSDSTAIVGRLIANGSVHGRFSGGSKIGDFYYSVLDISSANSTLNLANTAFKNCQILGVTSGASAILSRIYNAPYDSITPHFMEAVYANTDINWYLKGTKNDGTYNQDANGTITINNDALNEFTDYKRIAMSYSNQLASVLGSNASLVLDASITTQNTKISPVIDNLRSTATITSNLLRQEYEHFGYRLAYKLTSANSTISNGDTITSTSWGNTATGTVVFSNTTVIYVANVNGKFTNTTFTGASGLTGYVTAAVEYTEAQEVNLPITSRYISKNVILNAGQDSEDIIAYLTAYRPTGTNFMVFAKILNTADNEQFRQKRWSRMYEVTSRSQLYSSTGNIDDQIEIQYNFPTSQLVYNSNTSCNTTSANVSVTSTQYLSNNSCIYFYDSTSKNFNVRKVIYVTNSTSVVVDRIPSFTSANANLGVIPGLMDSCGAFLYDQGNNIVRYCTSSDAVFERYIQFAIKIVPVGNNSLIVPRCADVRALALQV